MATLIEVERAFIELQNKNGKKKKFFKKTLFS